MKVDALTKYQVLKKGGPRVGDCHGHLFDTLEQARKWCTQEYLCDGYVIQPVITVECVICRIYHISTNGIQGWSCQDG